ELCAEAPAAQLDTEIARDVFVLRHRLRRAFFRQPQIVALNQDAVLRNVRNVYGVAPAIQDVAERDVHPAFRREAHAGLLAGFAEAIAVVQVELGDAVVVGDEEVGATGFAQIRRGRSKRPAPTVNAELGADF